MKEHQSLGVYALLIIFAAGAGIGRLLQALRSDSGHPPFYPPLSLPASLLVISGLLLFFALRLRAALENKKGQTVNPFHAVRVLAASRASQITGSLFAGFGLGLLLVLVGRPVGVAVTVWLPMLLALVAGVILLATGIYAEHVCKVPPSGDDEVSGDAPETGEVAV